MKKRVLRQRLLNLIEDAENFDIGIYQRIVGEYLLLRSKFQDKYTQKELPAPVSINESTDYVGPPNYDRVSLSHAGEMKCTRIVFGAKTLLAYMPSPRKWKVAGGVLTIPVLYAIYQFGVHQGQVKFDKDLIGMQSKIEGQEVLIDSILGVRPDTVYIYLDSIGLE